MKQLTPADAQVIDLLLDGNGQLDGTEAMKNRLAAARKLLGVLDAMPAIDGPSTDLIDRTLARVEDAAGRVTGIPAQEGTFLPPAGPLAS